MTLWIQRICVSRLTQRILSTLNPVKLLIGLLIAVIGMWTLMKTQNNMSCMTRTNGTQEQAERPRRGHPNFRCTANLLYPGQISRVAI